LLREFEKFKKLLVGDKVLITEKDSKNIKFNLKVFGEHNQKNANTTILTSKLRTFDYSSLKFIFILITNRDEN
jgi:hypothetical protein